MKNEQPVVTVLINNYNYGNFIRQAVESVLQQDYKNVEIIIVDDGSTDNSKEILCEYKNCAKIFIKENGGQASAFNEGFFKSSGDIICFLDSDDYFFQEKISTVVDLFKKNPEAGWIFHQLQYTDKGGNPLPDVEERATEKLMFADFREHLKNLKKMPYFPATTALSFRRKILLNVFPIPEIFRISADSFLRLASISQSPGVLCPYNLSAHRQHGENLFVMHPDMYKKWAENDIYVAFYLNERFPEYRAFTNRMFSRGAGRLIAIKGFKLVMEQYEVKSYIKNFKPGQHFSGWFSCLMCAFLNFAKEKKRMLV
jgi:glycosyltransferase involved in cell wall biosynthesis